MDATETSQIWTRKAAYCDFNTFGIYICNNYRGFEPQKSIENTASRDVEVAAMVRC
jgi:hypothetical protein